MRRIIPLLLLSALWGGAAEAENITLYDMDGEAAAYIDTEDRNTIYLWSGEPAAYVLKRGSIPEIFGFNGRHLGWLEKGIVRDHGGSWRASPKALSICTRGRSTTGRRRCRSPSGRSRSSRRKGLSTGTLFQVRLLLSSSCRAGINSRLQRAHPVPSRFVLPSPGQHSPGNDGRTLSEEDGKFRQVFPFPPLAV